MKELWNLRKKNVAAVEVGLINDEENPYVKSTESGGRKQLIQYVKIIGYLELLLFVTFASYTFWQIYHVNSNHNDITNDVQQPKSSSSLKQDWLSEKNRDSSEKLYESEDILTSVKNFSQESEYFNKEVTVVSTIENSDAKMSETTESSTVSKEYNISNEPEDQFENTSEDNASKPQQDFIVRNSNLSNDSASKEGFDVESKAKKTLGTSDYIVNEETKEIVEHYILFLLIQENVMKETKFSKDLIENDKEKKADFEMYSDENSDEFADDSSIISLLKALIEIDNEEGILEDKLISLENSNVYKDTAISQSIAESTDETRQAETFTDSDEYPEIQESTDDYRTSIPVEDYLNKDSIQSTAFDDSKENSKMSDSSQISPALFEVNNPNYFLGLQTPFSTSKVPKPVKFMDTMNSEEFDSGNEWIRRLEKRSDNSATTTNKDSTRTYTENKEEKSDDHLMPQFLKKKIQNDIIRRSLNTIMKYKTPASTLRNAIRERGNLLARKIANVNEQDQELIKNGLNKYFHRLEMLAAHIDKLHERYLRLNELNDDYISKEFPSEYYEK